MTQPGIEPRSPGPLANTLREKRSVNLKNARTHVDEVNLTLVKSTFPIMPYI